MGRMIGAAPARNVRRHKWSGFDILMSICDTCGALREIRDVQESPHGNHNWPLYRYQLKNGQDWTHEAPECTGPPFMPGPT